MASSVRRPVVVFSVLTIALALALAAPIAARAEHEPDDAPVTMTTVRESELAYAAVPDLPPGAEVAVIAGDPAVAGQFTIRLRMPAGFRIPPHRHPATEHVTIVRGRMGIATGETYSEKDLTWLARGDFFTMPAGTPHFGLTKSETILEIDAIGPWGLSYVHAEDAPSAGK